MLWFINLTVTTCHYYSIHISEFMPISLGRKRTKHENTRSLPFSCDKKNGHRRTKYSIKTERAPLEFSGFGGKL